MSRNRKIRLDNHCIHLQINRSLNILVSARNQASYDDTVEQVETALKGVRSAVVVGVGNVALDVACYNFGVQEYSSFNERVQEVFQGCPVLKNGYLYPNEAPGWGIEVDEKAAARHPFGSLEQGERKQLNGGWGEIRRLDGTVIKQ